MKKFLNDLTRKLPWQKPSPKAHAVQATPTAQAEKTGAAIPARDSYQHILNSRQHGLKLKKRVDILAGQFATARIDRARFTKAFNNYQAEIASMEQTAQQDEDMAQSSPTGKVHPSAGHIIGFTIYDRYSGIPLKTGGHIQIDPGIALSNLGEAQPAVRSANAPSRKPILLENGTWAYFIRGDRSQTVLVFQRQPSSRQLMKLEDIQAVFEKANHYLLQKVPVNPAELVCPLDYFLDHPV